MHYFLTVLAAVLGGLVARVAFSAAMSTDNAPNARTRADLDRPARGWLLIAAFLLSGLTVMVVFTITRTRLEPEVWAGTSYLFTWWLIGMTALGALVARTGAARSGWRPPFWGRAS